MNLWTSWHAYEKKKKNSSVVQTQNDDDPMQVSYVGNFLVYMGDHFMHNYGILAAHKGGLAVYVC